MTNWRRALSIPNRTERRHRVRARKIEEQTWAERKEATSRRLWHSIGIHIRTHTEKLAETYTYRGKGQRESPKRRSVRRRTHRFHVVRASVVATHAAEPGRYWFDIDVVVIRDWVEWSPVIRPYLVDIGYCESSAVLFDSNWRA